MKYKPQVCKGYKLPVEINRNIRTFFDSPQTKLIFHYPGGSMWIFQSVLESMSRQYSRDFWNHVERVSKGTIRMESRIYTPTELRTYGNPRYSILRDGDVLNIGTLNAATSQVEGKEHTYLVTGSGEFVVPYGNPDPIERIPLRMVVNQQMIACVYREGQRVHRNPAYDYL